MKFTWLTDVHLDFLDFDERHAFYEEVAAHEGKVVLMTGDIGNSLSTCNFLKEMEAAAYKPIYYVLGNHDYYRGSIASTKEKHLFSTANLSQVTWLHEQFVELTPDLFLVGADGWADMQYGNWETTSVHKHLNDHYKIEELYQTIQGTEPRMSNMDPSGKWREKLTEIRRHYSMQDVASLRATLEGNKERFKGKTLLVLTHIPPFPRNSLYYGAVSDPDRLPFYTNKNMGDLLIEEAGANPDTTYYVLCGHAHSPSLYRPLSNLTVQCGRAEYKKPEVQEFCELEKATT